MILRLIETMIFITFTEYMFSDTDNSINNDDNNKVMT